MFKNNVTIALRQLSKNKSYAAINIFGLAVAVAACLLIYRILRYETSFNQNFERHERIARVVFDVKGTPGGDQKNRAICIPAMTETQAKIRDFEATSRIHEDWPTFTVPNPAGGAPIQKMGIEDGETAFFAEPDFLKIFDFKWIVGDAGTALNETGSIVLSRKVAEKCFQTAEKALNQTIVLDNTVPVIVRGVIENLPKNCDLPVVSITSYSTLQANAGLYFFEEKDWNSTNSSDQLFVLFRKKEDIQKLTPALAEIGQTIWSEMGKSRGITAKLLFQPLDEVHFDEEIGSSVTPSISRSRLVVLASIGLLVLAMACFNFINLATALASTRAREVGVRKAIGGQKSTLIAQFMTETGLIVAFSIALGCVLAFLAAPLLSKISDVPTSQAFFSDPKIWGFLAAVFVAVSSLSGLWPSFVLAGMAPVQALKNESRGERRGVFTLRKGLVVAQFSIAQALIIGAIVTISQLNFVRKMDMGFSKDLILTARFNGDSASLAKIEVLKRELLAIPTVESASFASDKPASGNTNSCNFSFARRPNSEDFNTTLKRCDADYQKTYSLKMAAGKWFAPSDTVREVVVNETMCRKLGVDPAAAIGQEIKLGSQRWASICGVVADFQAHSAHRDKQPMTLSPFKVFYSQFGVKIKPGNLAATTSAIQKAFDTTFPEQIFESKFLDESVAEFYQSEERFSAFCKGIAFLAVLIGCLGLFGLAAHTAQKRRKEIGVRKVLGASVGSLTNLLARDFLILVLVAVVLAAPVAIFLMRKWLDDFAFRIQIEWWMVAATALGAVGVAFLTVSFQAVKAALVDPVKSLRSE